MEIPTEKIIEQLKSIIVADPAHGQVTAKSVLIPLDAIEVIEKQAKEILELQAVVVRLRDEMRKMHHNEHRAIEILVHGDGLS